MTTTVQPLIRVALADDHTMFRKAIVSMLEEAAAFEVVAEASNGKELVDIMAGMTTLPDVVLLDINMPVMNGHETLVALKAKYPTVKYLILTMLDHELVIHKMLRNGANGYLLKDSDPEELLHAIEYVYKHSFYHSDLVSGRLISIMQKGLDYAQIHVSEKEQKFLELCCTELTYKEIADKMELSVRTVEGYRDTLFDKLEVKSRTGLIIYAMKLGIASISYV